MESGWIASAYRAPSTMVGTERRDKLIGTIIHATKGGVADTLVENLPGSHSWHFTIARDGRVFQHVSLLNAAAHAGQSRLFLRNRFVGGSVLNRRTLGIELANWLAVVKDRRVFRPYNHNEKIVVKKKRCVGIGKTVQIGQSKTASGEVLTIFWETYTSAQIQALKKLLDEIATSGFPEGLLLLRHEDVSPGRKVDPGPAFPFSDLEDWASTRFQDFSIAA